VAKSHLEKISLDTMIGQAADRRGYLYTEIKAELNAAKVVANGIIDHLSQIEDFEGMDLNLKWRVYKNWTVQMTFKRRLSYEIDFSLN